MRYYSTAGENQGVRYCWTLKSVNALLNKQEIGQTNVKQFSPVLFASQCETEAGSLQIEIDSSSVCGFSNVAMSTRALARDLVDFLSIHWKKKMRFRSNEFKLKFIMF